ncbi:MAG: hypothetical protein NT084_14680 [Bacteroidetes bacterium]|nr:hypothetical protein [Bacteroidota bacterium]
MHFSLKTFLFFFLPFAAVLFFQAEKNRLISTQHKTSLVDDQSDVYYSYDDDSFSFPGIDEDGDETSESVVRLLPVISYSISIESLRQFKTEISLSNSCKNSHRENSPSFLKVFRI